MIELVRSQRVCSYVTHIDVTPCSHVSDKMPNWQNYLPILCKHPLQSLQRFIASSCCDTWVDDCIIYAAPVLCILYVGRIYRQPLSSPPAELWYCEPPLLGQNFVRGSVHHLWKVIFPGIVLYNSGALILLKTWLWVRFFILWRIQAQQLTHIGLNTQSSCGAFGWLVVVISK